jgi:methylthioribose-1-phosphate isomerase
MTTDFAPRESLGLRCAPGRLQVLDQRLLPEEERWIDASAPEACVAAIQGLAVRGAPLIGVSAALCLAANAERGLSGRRCSRRRPGFAPRARRR